MSRPRSWFSLWGNKDLPLREGLGGFPFKSKILDFPLVLDITPHSTPTKKLSPPVSSLISEHILPKTLPAECIFSYTIMTYLKNFVKALFFNTEQCQAGLSLRIIPPVSIFLPRNALSFNVELLCPPRVDWLLPLNLLGKPSTIWLFLLGRLKLSVPRFEKGGSEKKECLGGLKKFLPQIVALGELNMFLLHTFVTECNSRKYWNNLFCLVYDNNSKEFYRVYLSHCKRKSVFFDDFEFNIIYFPANWKTYVIIFKVILRSTGTSTTWQFCAWFQSCTSTCSRFAIVKVSKSNYTFKIC